MLGDEYRQAGVIEPPESHPGPDAFSTSVFACLFLLFSSACTVLWKGLERTAVF